MDSTLHEQLIRTAVVDADVLSIAQLDFGSHNLKKFTTPEPNSADVFGSIFATVEVQNTTGSERSLGIGTTAAYREGALFIGWRIPLQYGRRRLDEKVDAMASYFHLRALLDTSGLMTVRFVAAPAPTDVGARGQHYRVNQRFRFWVEDRTA